MDYLNYGNKVQQKPQNFGEIWEKEKYQYFLVLMELTKNL